MAVRIEQIEELGIKTSSHSIVLNCKARHFGIVESRTTGSEFRPQRREWLAGHQRDTDPLVTVRIDARWQQPQLYTSQPEARHRDLRSSPTAIDSLVDWLSSKNPAVPGNRGFEVRDPEIEIKPRIEWISHL